MAAPTFFTEPLERPDPWNGPTQAVKRKRSMGTVNEPIELDTDEDNNDVFGNVQRRRANEGWNAASCLQRTLEVFPDIAHGYVVNLWNGAVLQAQHGAERFQQVLEAIMEAGNYPRERDRRVAAEPRENTLGNHVLHINSEAFRQTAEYRRLAAKLLAKEFRNVPNSHARNVFLKSKSLKDAYPELVKLSTSENPPWPKKKAPREPEVVSPERIRSFDPMARAIHEELSAARNEWAMTKHKMAEDERIAQIEVRNEIEAQAAGLIQECACCFNDTPLNRMITCDGATPHHFCYRCTKTHVESLIGSGQCYPKCMDMSGCDSEITQQQLRICIVGKTVEHLLRLQQQHNLRAANIEGLTECPFCDFMGICPSTDVDREFRCENPECGKVSCRLCNSETHIPLSCEYAAKKKDQDAKIDARHVVEEAMTDALIRSCNDCKVRFVKELGCNKMTCPKCGNTQCYLCHQNVKGYDHFGNLPGDGKCPTQDVVGLEVKHQEDVKRAGEAASAKVLAERPYLASEDLAISVSEDVHRAERRARHGEQPVYGLHGFPRLPLRYNDAEEAQWENDEDDEDDADGVGNIPYDFAQVLPRERLIQMELLNQQQLARNQEQHARMQRLLVERRRVEVVQQRLADAHQRLAQVEHNPFDYPGRALLPAGIPQAPDAGIYHEYPAYMVQPRREAGRPQQAPELQPVQRCGTPPDARECAAMLNEDIALAEQALGMQPLRGVGAPPEAAARAVQLNREIGGAEHGRDQDGAPALGVVHGLNAQLPRVRRHAERLQHAQVALQRIQREFNRTNGNPQGVLERNPPARLPHLQHNGDNIRNPFMHGHREPHPALAHLQPYGVGAHQGFGHPDRQHGGLGFGGEPPHGLYGPHNNMPPVAPVMGFGIEPRLMQPLVPVRPGVGPHFMPPMGAANGEPQQFPHNPYQIHFPVGAQPVLQRYPEARVATIPNNRGPRAHPRNAPLPGAGLENADGDFLMAGN